MPNTNTIVYTNNKHYQDIADAIREKNGTENTYTPGQMAEAILALEAGEGPVINNQNKTITPTETRQYITADTGYTGLGQVVVEPINNSYVDSGVTRKTSGDLSAAGATITAPAGYYETAASASVAAGSATTPDTTITLPGRIDISVDENYGTITVITPKTTAEVTPTIVEGYISSGTSGTITVNSKTNSANMNTKSAATIIPSNTTQTAVSKGRYVTGNIDVAPVPAETTTITSNGTYTPTEGKWFSSVEVNVPVGSTINNQNKSVTPTKSQQSVSADSGYTGLGTVTVNAIPVEYITTSDADAVAANILLNKTAYVDGSKITGSMLNNGATGGTITAQGGTYTIPAGYTTGGTVTASLIASPITNSALNVASFEETTGDYGVRASITIPAGYYENTTLTKDLSTVLPAPDTAAAAAQMLAGYQAYNNEGQLLTGTMTNNAAWSQALDQTTTSVTIPVGYHNGTGTVSHATVDIPDPNISVSNGGLITASNNWTRGFTTDNSYSKTLQLTTQAAKTVTPTESEQNAVAAGVYTTGIVKVGAISSTYVGSGITQRDSDDLTVSGAIVTAPVGYYAEAASKSVANMTLPTAAATSATSGATNKATIGRSTSIRYINIPVGYNNSAAYYTISATPNGSVTAPSSISGTTATVSTGTNTLTLTKTVSVTPNVTTAGYISSGTAGNSSVSLTANVTTKAAATITPGTSDQTIASGTYLTGAQTIVGDTDLIAKNIKSGISIFGVTGNFTADATATAEDIIQGETAYINGAEITGTLIVNKYYTGSAAPSSSLGNNGDIYFQN